MLIIKETDSLEIRHMKEKFNECDCKAYMHMLRGRDLMIQATNYGVHNDGYTDLVCAWDEFDSIIKMIKSLGGKMYKGDGAAQNGFRIGSDKLPISTMESFVAMKFYGAKEGDTVTRRSTYYAAILAWAGIVKNVRASHGEGSYVLYIFDKI